MFTKAKIEKMIIVVTALVLMACEWSLAADCCGLVSYWKFDEDGNSVACDSAGTNHGIIHGATWADGKVGSALRFDGYNDYVDCGSGTSLNLGSAFTFSMWICRYVDSGGYERLISKSDAYDPGRRDYDYYFQIDPGGEVGMGLSGGVGLTSFLSGSRAIPTGQWCHLAGVKNPTNPPGYAIYVNGSLDRSGITDGVYSNCQDKNWHTYIGRLGKDSTWSYGFNGLIDEVQIYNRALSADEIRGMYVDGSPVAHWKFDETEGPIAYDSAGHNHGTIIGAQRTTGVIGGALDFDGYRDYVQIPDDDSLTPRDEITIAFWVYNRGGQRAGIYKYAWCPGESHSPGNSRAYHLSIETTGQVRSRILSAANNYDDIMSNTTVSFGEWHHVTLTFNRGDASIFIDGRLDNAQTMSVSSIMNDAQPLIIGGWWDYCGTDNFVSQLNGMADDVRIYNRALSGAEVRQLCQVEPPQPPYVGEFYYVDGIEGSNLNDGLSLETAFATVQKGIDSAQDGNTVLVYPAVYSESINFNGKAVTVQGVATDGGIPILQASDEFGVWFYSGEDSNSILKNLVIRDCNVGIFIADASPTIANLTVVDNGKGIAAYGNSDPDISNCVMWNNGDDLYQCYAQYSWVGEDVNQPSWPNYGLVSHWQLDEREGSVAYDSAGSNHGTLHGEPVWTTGQIGRALELSGDVGYVEIADTDSLTPGHSITISYWLYNRGGQHAGIYKYTNCGPRDAYYLVIVNETNKPFFRVFDRSNDYGDLMGNNVVGLNKWHHIVGTFHWGSTAIYVDGEIDNADMIGVTSIGNDANPLFIGGNWSECDTPKFIYNTNGIIDDVAVWDRALSPEEVRELYETGLNGQEPSSGPMFADADNDDYHLLSRRGRYWPAHNVWVIDEVSSPCIDGGDPGVEPSFEPMPNGGRVNQGAYGNTPYASMSDWLIRSDVNEDGIVNMADLGMLANDWLREIGE